MRQSIWNEDLNGNHTQTHMHVVSGAEGKRSEILRYGIELGEKSEFHSHAYCRVDGLEPFLKHGTDFIL